MDVNAPQRRLNQISSYLRPNNNTFGMSSGYSPFHNVPLAPPDPIFNLTTSYLQDTNPKKVNLGVGAYRDNNGKPWVLPVVRKVRATLVQDENLNHEYLPITGLPSLTEHAAKLLLGDNSSAIKQGRTVTVQTISGTGANSIAAYFLFKYWPKTKQVLVSKPTWSNHFQIFNEAGFKVSEYAYYNPKNIGLDLDGMIGSLRKAEKGSIVVLHACAHNPTGIDPTPDQWKLIADVMQECSHFPLFDCAYQGFASGDLDKDAFAIRYFIDQGFEMAVCQSFAKNFGLYGERCGCLTFVNRDKTSAAKVSSQLAICLRSRISNPPAFGAKIVSTILSDKTLFKGWEENLRVMSGRIMQTREILHKRLLELKTPGNWDHIVNQIGMFSFTGLNADQVKELRGKYHIYMTNNGRISMAGLNLSNVDYVACAIDDVVRTSSVHH